MSTNNPPSQGDSNDLLGYKIYAQTLWSRIVAALDKDRLHPDKKLGDDPLVVGIFGEWGAGKSKLLSLIQEHAVNDAEIKAGWRKQDGGNCTLTVPVYFQPWKYEHEEHLHVPILLHILAALEQEMKNSQTWTEAFLQSLPAGVKEHLGKAVGAFTALLAGVAVVMDTQVPLLSRFGLGLAGLGATTLQSSATSKDEKKLADTVEFKANGRSFYEMHQTLQAITRPGKYAKQLTGVSLGTGVSINFVLFIDDLDRCLPEKSVATLELIKTIFNLESFAFVLALDEEVVERGIGHRYRDYALANKKPEMPITGFEYLEKIVHLPFRLPALTAPQAVAFMRQYEADTLLVHAASLLPPAEVNTQEAKTQWRQAWIKERTWFDLHEQTPRGDEMAAPDSKDQSQHTGSSALMRGKDKTAENLRWNLAELVATSFSAHVPRKLVRVVELFHQVLNVLDAQGRLMHLRSAQGSGDAQSLDPRLLMAHVLLQLFQPELHRAMRRSVTGFEVLLRSFEIRSEDETKARASARQLSASSSDVDILHWALYWSGVAPATLRSAHLRIASLDEAERHPAQRIRLVLAERLLEHRAQQRHVFDPLRLFSALQGSRHDQELGRFEGRHWFGLIAQVQGQAQPHDEPWLVQRFAALQPNVAAQKLGVDSRERVSLQDVNAVYLALISPELDEQARVAEIAGLKLGQTLDSQSVASLLKLISEIFILTPPVKPGQEWETFASSPSFEYHRSRLLQGLRHLAPYIAREDGAAFWDLVKDTQGYKPISGEIGAEEFKDTDTIARRELWADVRSTLGQDPRFEPKRFYLPKERFNGNGETQEPIPGFVRIPAGTYDLGATGEDFADNPPYQAKIEDDYYLARTHTTVDQYAAFIDAKGYEDEKLWDSLGWQWRTGAWDSKVKEKAYREHLASRKPELRHQPMEWDAQRVHGSRAVMQLNWFEARAYCNWLDAQMQNQYSSQINSILRTFHNGDSTKKLKIMLPIEMQWERAARAADKSTSNARQYPWGGEDQTTAHFHANLSKTDIDRTSVVGLFQTNPLGIADLAGNLWEWQDSLYQNKGLSAQGKRLPNDVKSLITHEKWEESDRPALRGGSWLFPADDAQASFRGGLRPVGWDDGVGFRVVLSLA